MNNQSKALSKKSDMTLLVDVKALVRREKEIVVEVIEYLKEIEVTNLIRSGEMSLSVAATTQSHF
jgi:hypothetical protein